MTTSNPWLRHAETMAIRLGAKFYPDSPEKSFECLIQQINATKLKVWRDDQMKALESELDTFQEEAADLQDKLDDLLNEAGTKDHDELLELVRLAKRLKELAASPAPSPAQ